MIGMPPYDIPVIATVFVATIAVALAALLLYRLYQQRKRKKEALRELEELFPAVDKAMRRRGASNEQLLENKLSTASEHIEDGKYDEAERVMHDVLRLIQLS